MRAYIISPAVQHWNLTWPHASLAMTILMLSGLMLTFSPCLSYADIFKCVHDGQVTYSGSKCADDAQALPIKNDQPAEQHRTQTLYLNAQRHFTLKGMINSHPVEFIVDTGSSTTVISRQVAKDAGIDDCTKGGFTDTANGVVPNCVATVPEISFGIFHMRNVTVTILPALNVDALLGMDVLQQMKVQQHGDVMYISD